MSVWLFKDWFITVSMFMNGWVFNLQGMNGSMCMNLSGSKCIALCIIAYGLCRCSEGIFIGVYLSTVPTHSFMYPIGIQLAALAADGCESLNAVIEI